MALTLHISSKDVLLERHANMLAMLSGSEGKRAMARALTHEGNKTTTQVRRAIAQQMGSSYGGISRAVMGRRATYNNLSYVIEASGEAPNLIAFKASQTQRGVTAAPWGKRQGPFRNEHGGSFIAKGRVFIRQSKSSLPIKQLFGPSIANEMVRDASMKELDDFTPRLQARLSHELMYMIMGGNRTGAKGG